MNFLNNFGKFIKNHHVLWSSIVHRHYKTVPTPFLLPHRNENVYEKAIKQCQKAGQIMKEITQLYSRPPRYFIDPYLRRFSCDKGDWCQGYICKDKGDNPCICPPKKKKGDPCKKKDDPCKKKDDPCKKKDDPCKKKDDPCKKKDKKKDDPCKKKDKKKDDPCKKKDKKDDPCKKKDKKDDPCKKKDKKKDDPCKKKDDPCKKDDKGKDDPCKKFKKDKTKKCESGVEETKAIKEPSSAACIGETTKIAAKEDAPNCPGWDIFEEVNLVDPDKLSLAEEYCEDHYANTTYLSYHQYTFHDIQTHLVDSRLPQPSVKPKKKAEDDENV